MNKFNWKTVLIVLLFIASIMSIYTLIIADNRLDEIYHSIWAITTLSWMNKEIENEN